MIEALLLCMAVGFVVLLIRSTTRTDTTNPDELLGLFAYKSDRNEPTVGLRKKEKNIA